MTTTKTVSKESNHKVNLRIKGDLRHLTFKLHALLHATKLGLKTNKLIKHQPGQLELEFEGEKGQLWKIVKWARGRRLLSTVDEVMFTFSAVSLGTSK